MDCKAFSDLLDAFSEGSLPEDQAEEMRAHAAECPSCAALLQQRLDCRALDEEAQVPPEFSAAWRQRIREEETKAKRASARRWRGYLAAAAALIFVAGGVLLAWKAAPSPEAAAGPGEPPAGLLTAERSVLSNAPSAVGGDAGKEAPAPLMASAYQAPKEAAAEMEAVDTDSILSDAGEEAAFADVSFTVLTADFDADLRALQELAEGLSGRAEALPAEAESGDRRSSLLTLRLPASAADAFLTEARGLFRTVDWAERGLPEAGSAVVRVAVREE